MKSRKFTSNISLKIMSVLVGILVWLLVVNIDNPVKTRTFVISGENVEVINKAYVDSDNKMVMQDDDPASVRVTITAERKTLARITSGDISVVADLQQAANLDTTPVMVPITASCSSVSPEKIQVSPQYMEVRLEEKASQDFLVNANYGSSTPGKGYEVGTQTATPEKVKITGPKSLINKIDKVNATVNVDGETEDVTEEVSLQIIDKNQDSMTDGKMAYLTIDNPKVTVTTRFWKIQTEIKLRADYVGSPAEGYQVDSVTTVPDTISIAGTDAALALLKQDDNTLWIAGDGVDISGEKKDVERKVSLKDVLPTDTKLTSGASEDVLVRVSILPEGSKAFTILASEIEVKNKPSDYQYAFDTDSIRVKVKATKGNIDDFDADQIQASIDLADKSAGSYEVPVEVELPSGYELVEDVTTDVTISEISNVEENEKSE